MNNSAFLEWIGDYGFIIAITVGSVAIIGYLWARFNHREKGR